MIPSKINHTGRDEISCSIASSTSEIDPKYLNDQDLRLNG
uniref:Uncharacterized protein n=1 Tax=Arundo donax TaxID=35708 RepID=A0A0A8Y7B2_ARUDO